MKRQADRVAAATNPPSTTRERIWLITSLVFGAGYVLSTYQPPLDPTRVGDATAFTRQFPTVPPAWVAGRLGLLALAALAFVRATPSVVAPQPNPPPTRARPTRPEFLDAALVWAAALCLLSPAAAYLGPLGQTLFVAAVPVPALLTHGGYRRRGWPRIEPATVVGALLCAGWVLARTTLSPQDARAATPVDTWLNFASFDVAVRDGGDLLHERFEPGVTNLLHLLCGAPILQVIGRRPTLAWMVGANFVWLGVAAAALLHLARRLVGSPAACVAIAAFLFSPASTWLAHAPVPLSIPIAIGTGIFAFFHAWYTRRSAAALVALATLIGASLMLLHVVPIAALIGLATVIDLARRRNPDDARLVSTAALSFTAIAIPLLPDARAVQQMQAEYLQRFVPWQLVESVLLGQVSPYSLLDVTAQQRPVENALAALLSPVVTARTALRLWGDTWIEPVAAALALLGAISGWRRRDAFGLRLPVAFAAIALLPALTSSYDRPSLIRAACMPAMLSVLAAGGARHVLTVLQAGRGWPPYLLVAAVIGVSGTWLFDRVNPRIVSTSWVTLAIEATHGDTSAILLDFSSDFPRRFLHVTNMSNQVPAEPRRVLPFSDAARMRDTLDVARPTFLWSPALEAVDDAGDRLCVAWPALRRFELYDRAGISRALAASVDPTWQPHLPRPRWRELPGCTDHADEGASPKSTRKTLHERP